MLDPKVMNDIKVARIEFEASLKSRIGREAKKTALANVLINNVVDIIETCLEAEDLFHMLNEERSKVAALEAKLSDNESISEKTKKVKNG